jgi:arabinogalactan oligomer / maltooligosaccharide transport system permease protein
VRSRTWVAWAFLAPTLVAMAILVFYPLAQAFFWTVTDIDRSNMGTIFRPPSWEFVGLDNFVPIITGRDPLFNQALVWTIIWTVVNVFFHYTIGLLLAVVLNQKLRGRTAFRLLLLVPWAIPIYISAVGWSFIFNGEFGLLNNLLGLFGVDRVAWYSEAPWYYVMPIIVNVWAGVPFMMVALLGGLQSIPHDQYEAANVDGASRWQAFWNITLPGLRSVSTTVILLGIIWTFNLFAVIFFTTRGGPAGKTNILVTYAFEVFNRGELALAASYAVVIFSFLIVFSLFYRRLTPENR